MQRNQQVGDGKPGIQDPVSIRQRIVQLTLWWEGDVGSEEVHYQPSNAIGTPRFGKGLKTPLGRDYDVR